jgi:hypothetical protein
VVVVVVVVMVVVVFMMAVVMVVVSAAATMVTYFSLRHNDGICVLLFSTRYSPSSVPSITFYCFRLC